MTYLNRNMLPPDAVLDVQLGDVSRADAPSTLLSAQRYGIARVPFPFTLSYDGALIDLRMADLRMTYGVQAKYHLMGGCLSQYLGEPNTKQQRP